MSKNQINTHELKDIIRFTIEVIEQRRLPICVWGSHGIGKTEIVGQVVKEMGYNLVVLHLSTQDITDLIGIPYQKDGIQYWSIPKWLGDANKNYADTGVPNYFFLDEMNRGHPIVHKAMLPLLLDGTLHLHKIGPKDCIIAACNPATDDYDVNEMSDKALNDRLGHVIFKPTAQEYLKYCQEKSIDSSTIQLLKKNPKFTAIPKEENEIKINPSRRAIFNVMSVIGKKDKNWIRNRAGHILECYLGEEFKDLWLQEFVKNDIDVNIDMLKDISKNKKVIEERITKVVDNLHTCSLDVVEKLTGDILVYIQDKDTALSKDDMEWITEFYSIPIIPEEFPRQVFIDNDVVYHSIIKDKVINRMVGELLDKRKLQTHEPVKGW
jgi:hypothetical protein